MNDARSLENTPRVVALAIAFFGGLALAGWTGGVFARFDADDIAALAIFALGFASLTIWLDPGVRELLARLFTRRSDRSKSAGSRPAIT